VLLRIRSPVRRDLQRERTARGKTETEITIITGAEILRIKTENRSSAGKMAVKTAATEKVTTATVATTVRNVTEGTITVVTITITTSKKIMNSRISLKEG
jgi:hypothetical protein